LNYSFWRQKDFLLLDKQTQPSNMGKIINHHIP